MSCSCIIIYLYGVPFIFNLLLIANEMNSNVTNNQNMQVA